MDLEEFVASSLTQIIKAVQKSQKDAANTGAWINPAGYGLPTAAQTIDLGDDVRAYIHDVKFDVAVTVSDKQGAEAGAKVQVFVARLGGGGKVEYENEAVSRVKFSVPVIWPPATREEREKKFREGIAAADARQRAEIARSGNLIG